MSATTAELIAPEEQLQEMVSQLRQHIGARQSAKVFQLRTRIKEHCTKHGLRTPEEAYAYGRAPKLVPLAPPATTAVLPMATRREAQPLPPRPAPKTGPEREEELATARTARAKLRALRVESWKLIETVQDLPLEDLQALIEDLRYVALGANTALNVVKIRLGKA